MKNQYVRCSSLLLVISAMAFSAACDSQRNAPDANAASLETQSKIAVDPAKQALDNLTKAAQSGDVKAQANLGRKYIYGGDFA